ncbi:MAG: ankyrin repeat domain-containing protein [Pseudomonadota bacterium]
MNPIGRAMLGLFLSGSTKESKDIPAPKPARAEPSVSNPHVRHPGLYSPRRQSFPTLVQHAPVASKTVEATDPAPPMTPEDRTTHLAHALDAEFGKFGKAVDNGKGTPLAGFIEQIAKHGAAMDFSMQIGRENFTHTNLLFIASRAGQFNGFNQPLMKAMLEQGADPNAPGINIFNHSETSETSYLLCKAIKNNDESMVRALLEHGANPNLAENGKDSMVALDVANKRSSCSDEIKDLLISHGATAGENKSSDTVHNTNNAGVAATSKNEVGANQRSPDGVASQSARLNQRERDKLDAKMIFELGEVANPRVMYDQHSVAHPSHSPQELEAMTTMLEATLKQNRGVHDLNKTHSLGEHALSMAIEGNNPRLVKMLLENGADPNTGSVYRGDSPLTRATELGNPDVIKLMKNAGASLVSKPATLVNPGDELS